MIIRNSESKCVCMWIYNIIYECIRCFENRGPNFFQLDDLQKDELVLKDRVREQRAINESRASKQEDNMNGLRTHLEQLVDDADQEDVRIKTVHTELIKLLESVEKLFLSVHCDLSPMYKILGKWCIDNFAIIHRIFLIGLPIFSDGTRDMK